MTRRGDGVGTVVMSAVKQRGDDGDGRGGTGRMEMAAAVVTR